MGSKTSSAESLIYRQFRQLPRLRPLRRLIPKYRSGGSDDADKIPLSAFQQSVHAVINYSEMAVLGQLIQKVVADNNLFLMTYREMQRRVAQSKV